MPIKLVQVIPYQGQYADVPEFQRPWEYVQVPSNRWAYSHIPLVTTEINRCNVALVRHKRQIGCIIIHAEPLFIDFDHWTCYENLQQLGNGKGKNLKAAIFLGTHSSTPTDTKNLLRHVGVSNIQEVRLDTGRAPWKLAYRPTERLVLVDQCVHQNLLVFQGF